MTEENLKDLELQYKDHIVDINDYTIDVEDGRLGHGGNGDVFKVINNKTKKECAAKILKRNCNEAYLYKSAVREIENMINCHHPTIIKIYGFSFIDFYNSENIVILMEYEKNGPLSLLIHQLREEEIEITNTQKQIILIGIAKGMEYLNFKNMVHRDLKPGNILLDENYHPKIIDFGHSKVIEDSIEASCIPGTDYYRAPEITQGLKYDAKADVFSFGIIMFELITYELPFSTNHGKKRGMSKMILNSLDRHSFDKEHRDKVFDNLDENISPEIRELIERCLSYEPQERPTFEEIFQKLAFNKDIRNADQENEEDQNDEDEDEEKNKFNYYLENVDVNQVLTYAYDINVITDDLSSLFVNQIKPLQRKHKKIAEEIELIKTTSLEKLNLLNLENEKIMNKN